MLFDLGVSSLQLDTPERGFSFRHDAPLDMRFSSSGPTAAQWLRDVAEDELVTTLWELGEEPRARRVARAILRARDREPMLTTGQLRRIVWSALGHPRGRIDPATRTFQAIRIAVNRELEGLPAALESAARRLAPGGRLVVIAFHSLEDRIAKHTMRRLSGRCVCPPGAFGCQCNPEQVLTVLTPRPVRAEESEAEANPRARSARLRVAAAEGHVKVIGYRPHNRWVRRPLDWGWWPWLKRCCLGALALAAVLGAFVGPRQTIVRTRYQIAQLTSEVERLEGEHRSLLLERERLTSPSVLAGQIDGSRADPGVVRAGGVPHRDGPPAAPAPANARRPPRPHRREAR